MIEKITIDNFTEKEYDLTEIGLKNYSLVIEEHDVYIEDIYTNFFLMIRKLNQFIEKNGNYYLIDLEDLNNQLTITKEQYDILEGILKNESNLQPNLSNT
jgi:hypothetical protein